MDYNLDENLFVGNDDEKQEENSQENNFEEEESHILNGFFFTVFRFHFGQRISKIS